MAAYQILFDKIPLANVAALDDCLARLWRNACISRNQYAVLRTELTPVLPCALTIGMRTHKGVVDVRTDKGVAFKLSPRAKLL